MLTVNAPNEPVSVRCDYIGCTERPTRVFVWQSGDHRLMLCGKHNEEYHRELRRQLEDDTNAFEEVPC